VELTGYLAVARRWWWTLLVATWVAGIAGWIVASSIPPTYEARTQLLVGPYNTDRDTLAASAVLVQTYSQLITTEPIMTSAIAEAGATLTPDELESATRVTADNTTRILDIRVQDTDPQMAATLANKLAAEISILSARGTNRPEGQIQIVDFARPPTDPIAPQKSLIVALAAIAALIGAMVLVLLVEYLSAAVRSEEELGRVTGLPFLGRVDIARSLPSSSRALIDNDPESAAAAAYRLVLAKVAFREGHGEPVRSVAVVGTGANPATGQVAANLAAITARGGRQVVLIDADTGDAPVSRIFGLMDRAGVTDALLSGRSDLSSALVRVSSTLSIVPRGMAAGEDQIDVERAKAMLHSLADQADIVMLNTGPLHLSAGALVWAQAADAATIVATLDQSRRDDLAYAVESLRLVGANVAGTVLADRRRGFGRARASAAPAPRPAVQTEVPRPAPRDRIVTSPLPATYPSSSPYASSYSPATSYERPTAYEPPTPYEAPTAYEPPTPMQPSLTPVPPPLAPIPPDYDPDPPAPRPMPTVLAPVQSDEESVDADDSADDGPNEEEVPPPPRPTTPRRRTRRRRQAGEPST
jgi:succinoglycan biosynthesis transport protein ExoP